MSHSINDLSRRIVPVHTRAKLDAAGAASMARLEAELAASAAAPWVNEGRTPQERAYLARKREAWERANGIAPVAVVPMLGLQPLPMIVPPPPPQRERKPRPRSGYRHHRDNVWYAAGRHQTKLSRAEVRQILSRAETIERETKQAGRFSGSIGQTGLALLRGLLTHFYNHKNGGQCDPSYDAIQQATGFCRQTIAHAIKRLEASGLMMVARRIVRVPAKVRCPATGAIVDCMAVQQTSNAYMFAVAPVASKPGGPAWDGQLPDDCRNASVSRESGPESTRPTESTFLNSRSVFPQPIAAGKLLPLRV